MGYKFTNQNIHGIQIHQPERWENIIKTSMKEYKSDLVGLCETGLNWKLPYIQNKVNFSSRQHIKINTNIIHSNNIAFSPTSFLPGGTLLATKGHWTGRIQQYSKDPSNMGRWIGAKYKLQNDCNLYI